MKERKKMITLNKYSDVPNSIYLELYGLSTDTKPVKNFNGNIIGNASTFYEMDTKKCYIYDAESHRWLDM